ncbi:unnamed protein product [Caenorhabditis bovis]|uniref:Protein kinase domain-containing protein n=1 Tax=Caenorhabditis bovis TaxID=2654633 RepID=A0A8S1EI43_9PELO|nr:unnamed protein product [Caenorhabditis bovis]
MSSLPILEEEVSMESLQEDLDSIEDEEDEEEEEEEEEAEDEGETVSFWLTIEGNRTGDDATSENNLECIMIEERAPKTVNNISHPLIILKRNVRGVKTLRDMVGTMNVSLTRALIRDMLSVLDFMKYIGIHQNISLDTILYINNRFMLTGFDFFTFKHRLEEDIHWNSIIYQPYAFDSTNPYDSTIDLFAFGIVLLQCFQNKIINIDNEKEANRVLIKCLSNLDSRHAHLVGLFLRSRDLFNHCAMPAERISLRKLAGHPVMTNEINSYCYKSCYFLHSYLANPMEELMYYLPDDTVGELIKRTKEFYSSNNEKRYVYVNCADFSEKRKVHFIDDNEQLKNIDLNYSGQFAMIPIEVRHDPSSKYKHLLIVFIRTEFSSMPILIETSLPKKNMSGRITGPLVQYLQELCSRIICYYFISTVTIQFMSVADETFRIPSGYSRENTIVIHAAFKPRSIVKQRQRFEINTFLRIPRLTSDFEAAFKKDDMISFAPPPCATDVFKNLK